jgi:protein-S-isoprenylcysteine O-methyltransferase Ste14
MLCILVDHRYIKGMDVELICKIALIGLYSLFSIIRIAYYRRVRKAGYKTVIEERVRYAIWLSIFICYEVFTFFLLIFFPEILSWAIILIPVWARMIGLAIGILALVWFIWVHQSLGNNLSVRLSIKDQHVLITDGPYHWIRHPMYSAFYLLHIAVFLLTANWFIDFGRGGHFLVIPSSPRLIKQQDRGPQ